MMKKLFRNFMVLMCIVSMMATGIIPVSNVEAARTKSFEYNAEQNMKNITLTWKKQKKVSYYKIYRAKLTEKDSQVEFPTQKEYKKIGKVSKNKNKYIDKKAKKGVKYSYIIKGYKKKKGKDKLVCSTFANQTMMVSLVGLNKPKLSNMGYGEDYSNSTEKLYVGVSYDYGVEPTGYVIYRKKEGEKSYKKIKGKKLEEWGNLIVFEDENVEPGCVYRYKVRSYKKVGKKKYYSKKSSYLKLSTTNTCGKYDVEMLTDKGKVVSSISFKVTSSDKYNADTLFTKGKACLEYQGTKKTENEYYSVGVTKYSSDNKIWMEIPVEGIVLKPNKTIYLQGDLYKYSDNEVDEPICVNWEQSKPYIFNLYWGVEESGITYKGSGSGYTEATFDFVTRIGGAYMEWD